MREIGRFRLFPLTPIHVGDGNELDPTSYLITSSKGSEPARLARFDPVATISGLTAADRGAYDRALRTGELGNAQQILQRAARDKAVPVAYVSDASVRELGEALTSQRSGRFSTMVRSGGIAILPGSTLKGALRTGLLHLETERLDGATRSRILAAIETPGRSGAASDRLQEEAFSRARAQTERDPMRDVSVADVALGENATVIDQVVDWKRERDGEFGFGEGFQLHVERCICVADAGRYGGVAPATVEISVTGDVVRERRAKVHDRDVPAPSRSPHLADLIRGLNEHHLGVWHLERERFFAGRNGRETASLLDACLAALGLRSANDIRQKPGWALLRLGWAGHFEAKSVAAVRQGYRPQSRDTKTATVGSTRHGVVAGGVFVPFGWALLIPEEEAPKTLPRITAVSAARRTAPPGSAAGPRAPASAGGGLLFRRGDRVTNEAGEIGTVVSDVKPGDTSMTVDIDGNLETERVGDWRRI
jgi:CRISPR-associated protein Csm5